MNSMAEMSVESPDPERWKKSNTRQAILQAARQLVAREGAQALSLGRVAVEAGFAAPAVFAYFVTKDELHLALVSDDLEIIARAMRGGEAPASQPSGLEPAEAGPAEADVIAFHRPIALDVALDVPLDDAPAAAGEPAAAVSAAPEEAAVSLEPRTCQDLERAIGLEPVLEPETDAAPAPGETVPDAFPEEAPLHAHQPEPLADQAATKAESRYRRSRPLRPATQIVMPLPAAPHGASHSDPASAPERTRESAPERTRESAPERTRESAPERTRESAPERTRESAPERIVAEAAEAPADLARLEATVARLESRPVDAWLERRLRVFERTLADLEGRMAKTEREAAAAVGRLDEGFGAFARRFEDELRAFRHQTQERDETQRAGSADLRAYLRELAGRMGVLEAQLSSGAPSADEAGQIRPIPPVEPRPEAGPDYLAQARRAANAATLAVRGPDRLSAGRGRLIGRALRRSYPWLIASLVLAIAALGGAILWGHAGKPAGPAAASAPAVLSTDARVVALAKAGNPQAELIAGLKLLNGDGITTDLPSAAYWLGLAAAKQQPLAQYWLGTLYERGRGVPKDKAKAMAWYAEAAGLGNAKAMYRLGVAYAEGWAGGADPVSAVKWFTAAARDGAIDAQFNLAVLAERGEGMPQSLSQAFVWYSIAAAQGDAESRGRIDALASRLSPAQVAAAQAQAAHFQPVTPPQAANAEPDPAAVAKAR